MKKIITLFILFVATQIFAQNNGISYQAIILNPKGEQLPGVNNSTSPLANKSICMVFKFVDEFSNVEYQETIQTKTDGFGMVNLVIGSGNQTAGYAASFKDIVWNISKKSLSVGINTDGSCTTFTEISNQEFSYVPLAFSAINAENVTGVVAIENGGTNAITLLGAKTNLEINNVDNTSDLNKPISTATQTALSLKEVLANKSTDVNVDGTSDTKYPSVKSVKMYVDGKLLTSSNALTAEVIRATAAENTIAADLATETTNRSSADVTLTSNLATEVTRAKDAENTIAADLATETTNRSSADATLTSNLATEVTRATAAETTLTTNLTAETNRATATELTKEALANKSTDVNVDGTSDTKYPTVKSVKMYVDASAASSSTALANEVSRATAAENTIAADLATETTNRTLADATLTNNLAAEVTRATTAENTIAADLATETTNRTLADATLTSNLAAEVTRATAAENTIAANLASETTNRSSADATLQTNINSVQADVDANELATNNALALKASLASPTFTGTVSGIDKTMIGLENADNTSDLSKPVSTATQTALDLKVDKVSGKGLSTEDYTSAEKSKLADITGTNTGDQDLSALATTSAMTTALGLKVDKVSGKGLSTEDYTSAEKSKLADITGTNTGDQDLSALATTSAMTTALGLKVDKVSGKGLSTEDYTSAEKSKLADITGTNTGDQDLSALATTSAMTTALGLKVDKVSGKGLSTEDYTSAEKSKLADITGTNTGDQDLSALATTSAMTTALGLKVDKVSGKGLSTEDYTSAEKSKLADITGTNTGDQDISGITTNSTKIGDLSELTTTAQSNLVAAVNELEAEKAPLASPALTGIPTAPTAATGTNTTQIATTAFVNDAFTGKFMDLTTNQTIAGEKTFSSDISANGIKISQGGGKIGIGTVNPNQESSLEIATALPVVLPLMSQNQIDAMTNPTVGMVQYNKTENKLQVYSTTDGSSNLSTVFGNSTTSSGATCLTSGELWFRPSVSGTITQIELSAFGAGETASLVLKSDFSCGSPAVLGTSNSITCIDGWNTWTFTTPVQVTAGTTYYITSNDANRCLGVRWANGDDVTTGSVDEDIFSPSGGCSLSNIDPASRITVVSSSSNSNWVNLIDGSHTSMINLATEVTDVLSVSNGGTGGTTSTGSGAVVLEFSPSLIGTPTVPTATAGTNTTQIATTAFVTNAVSNAIIEVADEFSAAASQTSFNLTQTPSTNSKLKMYINGIRISNAAYSVSGTTLTYNSANNGSYTLSEGDRIQFDYFY